MKPEVTFSIIVVPGGYAIKEDPGERLLGEGDDLRNLEEADRYVHQIAQGRGISLHATEYQGSNPVRYEGYPAPNVGIEISGQLDTVITDVARDLGITKGRAIVRAIALLKIAADAKRRGMKLGIAATAEAFEDEITGI